MKITNLHFLSTAFYFLFSITIFYFLVTNFYSNNTVYAITPSTREAVYQIVNPTVNQPVPIVVNLEVKERGRAEHLAEYAYNRLRDPVLTATLTSVFWIIIIVVLIKKKRK